MVVRADLKTRDKIMGKSKKEGDGPGSPATKGSGEVVIMDGMSASETTMIRRLAGNDPLIRKKTVKKLRKWLNAIALRAPDSPDCRDVIEANTVRVWKALFYCMWMADKPLPQEQLAEHISDLVSIFASKPNALLVFVEWFFRTMAREWSWIDRLRLDKFMMLVRRFLRKTLSVLSLQNWKAESTEGLIKIFNVHVFNHHPQIKTKKGSPQQPTVTCPVGFQIHLIDIFLEEVAKVDADGLKSSKVLKLLSPFINELATNDDQRILDEIRERVFHHLMRQSDIGMDYQEGLMNGGFESDSDEVEENNDDGIQENDEDEVVEDDANEDKEDDENEKPDDVEMPVEDEAYEVNGGPLDPRAGAVDVVLPQLEVDYSILAEKLTEAGGQKIVKKKNRGLLYTLATQFREIVQGKYPLALPEPESHKPAIPQKELKKATMRLVDEQTPGVSKIRKTKKQRRRDAKREATKVNLNDSGGSEDASIFLNDGELLDHVSDNYVSYVHEQMEDDSQDQEESETEDTAPKAKKIRVEKKPKGNKYKTVIEVEADELDGPEDISMDTLDPTENNSVSINGNDKEVILIRRPKSGKKKSRLSERDLLRQIMKVTPMKAKYLTPGTPVSAQGNSKISSPENSTESASKKLGSIKTPLSGTPLSSKLKGKTITPGSGGSGGSGFKKRVSFVLAKNKEHEATDYMGSIQSSPAIPFDGSRTPNYGLLKISASKSSPAMFVSSPRKRALDFF